MKKSDYDKLLKYETDPYQAWIAAYEDNEEKPLDENPENLLSELGYTLICAEGGRVDSGLYTRACEIIKEKAPDLIYTDEDVFALKRYRPYFKPDFSPDTLEGFFYIGSLLIVKDSVLDEYKMKNPEAVIPNRVREENYLELKKLVGYIFENNYKSNKNIFKSSIVHVPQVLYHADRERDFSYKDFEVKYLKSISPHKISAIILSKDNPGVLLSCVKSLLRSMDKDQADSELEIIVVDNGSKEDTKNNLERLLAKFGAKYFYHPFPFEYSTLCNFGARQASGDYLLFLNDDVLFAKENDDKPLLKMLTFATKEHVGAVGIKLLFPGGPDYPLNRNLEASGDCHAIQHAGISLMTMGPSHKLETFADDKDYYFGRNTRPYNCLAVTGACLLVNRDKFNQVDGFDEKLKIAYTDVDLCMDLLESGYYSVCLNNTWAYHFESLSRGNDVILKEKASRLKRERDIFFEKHDCIKEYGDIFIGPNITKIRLDYSVDYQQEWEKINFIEPEDRVPVDSLKVKGIKEAKENEIFGSIDRVKYIPTSSDQLPSYYEIEGWMLMHKADQLKYDNYIAILDKDYFRYYKVVPKYRPDICTVFPKEKNALMSGFILRIEEAEFERYNAGQICLAFKKEINIFDKTIIKYRKMDEEICLGS